MEQDIQEKVLICKDCHRKFKFTVTEQKNFGQRGWADPVRCKYCQRQKKVANNLAVEVRDGVKISEGIQFSEVCDKCHRPFYSKLKRKTGFNLYCDDCWNEIKKSKPSEENREENKGVAKSQAEAH